MGDGDVWSEMIGGDSAHKDEWDSRGFVWNTRADKKVGEVKRFLFGSL